MMPYSLCYSFLYTLQFVYPILKMWHPKWNANFRVMHVRQTQIQFYELMEPWKSQILKTMEIMLQTHNKIENCILNVPTFMLKISKSILDKKCPQKYPIHFIVSFDISFIYMHSCGRKKSLLLTVAMQNVLKNQWRMIRRAGPELKQNKKQQK